MIAGVIVLAVLVLVGGTALIISIFFDLNWRTAMGPFQGPRGPAINAPSGDFESNGQRIYYTGTSETGPPISARMTGMHDMPRGMMACVSCHGEDGRGGTARMMMQTFVAPDIRYSNLTAEAHGEDEREDEDHEEHPPYVEETIKRAITEGVDPAGETLEWMMPRWDMTDQQLEDLIAYLKTLGS